MWHPSERGSHPHQVIAKSVRVCLIAQLGRDAPRSLPRVVIPSHVSNNSLEVAYELALASSMSMFQFATLRPLHPGLSILFLQLPNAVDLLPVPITLGFPF